MKKEDTDVELEIKRIQIKIVDIKTYKSSGRGNGRLSKIKL